jgi:hypothetical protein
MNVHAPYGTSNKPIADYQIDRGMLFDVLALRDGAMDLRRAISKETR